MAVEQAGTNMQQIEKAVEDTNKTAGEALNKCNNMSDLLQSNLTDMAEVAQGLSEAVATTENYVQLIDELQEMAKKTNKIINAITNLALQTNMLSVTGAVEAARAGEFGKGFAVVSTDIQNLATEASENSDQTADMVDAIVLQLDNVRAILQKNIVEVSNIANQAKASTNDLQHANEQTRELVKNSNDIVNGASEVGTAVIQIKQSLEQIAAAAEQATTATGQAAAAAREQSDGTQQLASTIEEIASIADELQS